jgi:xanthine dehydrogenase accessory factor
VRRVERLTATGVTAAAVTACAPIGLDIGAVSPAEIAISVTGEIVLTRRQEPLRARRVDERYGHRARGRAWRAL